ncbi:MAG: ice-binding family protein [Umezawaea sp.]
MDRDPVRSLSGRPLRRARWGAAGGLVTAAVTLFAVGLLVTPAAYAATSPVGLGTVASYSVLGGQAVTNTGPSTLGGDLGVSPGTAITGFPPGTTAGATHAGDAQAAQAQSDLVVAYDDAAGRALTASVAGDLVGQTLPDGVYKSTGPIGLSGTLTLDGQGDPSSVFIFQIASTLITASASSVVLINGAQACNVYWQVGSSATLGTTSTFVGTILALTSISVTTGTVVEGRALARNGQVSLDDNVFTTPGCDTTPTTTTTDESTTTTEPTSTTDDTTTTTDETTTTTTPTTTTTEESTTTTTPTTTTTTTDDTTTTTTPTETTTTTTDETTTTTTPTETTTTTTTTPTDTTTTTTTIPTTTTTEGTTTTTDQSTTTTKESRTTDSSTTTTDTSTTSRTKPSRTTQEESSTTTTTTDTAVVWYPEDTNGAGELWTGGPGPADSYYTADTSGLASTGVGGWLPAAIGVGGLLALIGALLLAVGRVRSRRS